MSHEPVSLEEIYKKGFVFRETPKIPDHIINKIIQLDFVDACLPKGEQSTYARYLDKQKDKELFRFFINIWKSFTDHDPFISDLTEYMHVGIDKSIKGDYVMPHTDIALTGVCQAAMFIPNPDNNQFEGREFYYGLEDEFKVFRPKSNSICFIDTTNEKNVHAVSELASNHVFYAVGIYPSPPGGRNELLINRPELIEKWGIRNE